MSQALFLTASRTLQAAVLPSRLYFHRLFESQLQISPLSLFSIFYSSLSVKHCRFLHFNQHNFLVLMDRDNCSPKTKWLSAHMQSRATRGATRAGSRWTPFQLAWPSASFLLGVHGYINMSASSDLILKCCSHTAACWTTHAAFSSYAC